MTRPSPSTVATGVAGAEVEVLQFLRDRTAMIFTFLFPAMLLLLFGTIFGDDVRPPGVSASQVFSASMIAYGILATGVRHDGRRPRDGPRGRHAEAAARHADDGQRRTSSAS